MLVRLKAALDVATTLLVAAAASAILWRVYKAPPAVATASQDSLNSPSSLKDVAGLSIDVGTITNTRGAGRVALVEFSDYECPFCVQHARTTEPQLVKQFVETGKVRHIVFNYPLPIHPEAQKASEAAECAARQGRFWEMHDQLFADRTKLESDALLSLGSLTPDKVAFETCLKHGASAEKVRSDLAEGSRIGSIRHPPSSLGVYARMADRAS